MVTGNKRKKIIELLKSGNFTVASHDYGQVSLYEGKFPAYSGEWVDEMPVFPKENKEVARFNLSDSWGYMQELVALMTEALGGRNGGSA